MSGYQTDAAERQVALRRKADAANGPDAKTPEHPLLTLQSQIGNAQVARLLAQRAEAEDDELQAKHDLSIQRAAEDEDELQAKHDLSLQRAAEDEDELQASHDLSLQRVAEDEDQLQSKHDLSLQREASPEEDEELQADHDLSIQRAAEDEDELQAKHDLSLQRAAEDEDELQAKHDLSVQRAAEEEDELQASHDLAQRDEDAERVGVEGGPVGPDTAQRIASARGGGSSLDSSTRATMESGFGTSFEDVRVHHDSESDTLNRRLTSHAFTTGSDIFLRGDASASDNHLIAHELTHVVQQRSMSGGGGMSVGAAGDPHEHHADATADSVLSNAPAESAPAAQREAAPDEDEIQADHDLSLQREAAPDEDEVQADHDLSLQREAAPAENEVQAEHDLSLQREAAPDEGEVQADHDLSVERAAEDEDELQADHDVSLQREPNEDQSPS